MKHFALKFNHGVEIGARLAYLGHYKRTKDPIVLLIANEEKEHREALLGVLRSYNKYPSKPIDAAFTIVGKIINKLCQISPIFMLDLVARLMEIFAVFNYSRLVKKYPSHSKLFRHMSEAESKHEEYFK